MKTKLTYAISFLFFLSLTYILFFNYYPREKDVQKFLESNSIIHDEEIEAYKTKSKRAYDRPDLAFKHNFMMTKDIKLGRPTPEVIPGILKQLGPIPVNVNRSSAQSFEAWTNLGPNNVGGRTRAICIDANDPTDNTVFVGSVSGGLWKTTNFLSEGCIWQPVQTLPTGLSVVGIKQNPLNPNEIFLCTGEEGVIGEPFTVNSSNSFGMGVWKSSDGGNNWELLSALSSTLASADIDIDQQGRLYVAFYDGLLMSTDGGVSFENLFDRFPTLNITARHVLDIEIAADGRVIIACGIQGDDREGGIIYIDPNNNTVAQFPIPQAARIEVACAPSDANRMYALVQLDGTQEIHSVLRTDDGGRNWRQVNIPVDFVSYAQGNVVDFTRGQTWYNLIAQVHPSNPDLIVIGGIDLFRSTDGGLTWGTDWCKVEMDNINTLDIPSCPISLWSASQDTFYYVHADNHALVFMPSNPDALLVGNDGGIQFCQNIREGQPRFVEKNNNYIVTQYYSCAAHPEQNLYIGGAQDNGTHQFEGLDVSDENEINGGDGGYCFVLDDRSRIVSYVNNSFSLLTPSGEEQPLIRKSNDGLFINPADYDPVNRTLYTVHRVIDGSNSHWGYYSVPIDNGEYTGPGVNINPFRYLWPTSITSSPHNSIGSSTIFIGTEGSQNTGSYLLRVDNANSSNPRFTELASFPGGWISSIAVGETEQDLIVTFSNFGAQKIWLTRDGGNTWRNIDGNIPNIPIRSALFSPYDPNKCIIGTELGIWKCNDLNAQDIEWVEKNENIGRVRVDMLRRRLSDNQVIAASHGRGMWVSNIFEVDNITVQLTPDPVELPYTEGSLELVVNATTPWQLTENADWFDLSVTSGDSSARIVLTHTENEDLLPREDVIVVSGEGISPFEVVVKQEETQVPTLLLSNQTVIIPSDGDLVRTTIISNVDWRFDVDSIPDWLITLFPTRSSGQLITEVGISADPNDVGYNRFVVIPIISEAGNQTLTIAQPRDSLGYLNVSPEIIEDISHAGDNQFSITIRSDLEWSITSNRDWVIPEATSGRGNSMVRLAVDPNNDQFPRQAQFTVTALDFDGEEISRELELRQLPSPSTDSTIVSMSIYPNQTSGFFHMDMDLPLGSDMDAIQLVHIPTGISYPVQIQSMEPIGSGLFHVVAQIDQNAPLGAYVVSIRSGHHVMTKKIVKIK